MANISYRRPNGEKIDIEEYDSRGWLGSNGIPSREQRQQAQVARRSEEKAPNLFGKLIEHMAKNESAGKNQTQRPEVHRGLMPSDQLGAGAPAQHVSLNCSYATVEIDDFDVTVCRTRNSYDLCIIRRGDPKKAACHYSLARVPQNTWTQLRGNDGVMLPICFQIADSGLQIMTTKAPTSRGTAVSPLRTNQADNP